MRSICKSEHFEIDRQDFCPWQKFTFYVFCFFFLETRGLLARLQLIMKISHRIWNALINDRREKINGFPLHNLDGFALQTIYYPLLPSTSTHQ